MVKEIIIPIENKKAQIVEIREIENQVESQSKVDKITSFIGLSKVECLPAKSDRDRERERERRRRDLDARIVDRSKETDKESRQHNSDE